MRIAYLAQSYPPMISGAAIVVESLAKTLSKRGHEVLVIAASDTGHSYRVQERNLTVLRLRSLHNPLRVGQRFLLYPRVAVFKALRAFGPEIVHVHEPLQMGWLGAAYARRVEIPVVLTLHQLPAFATSYLTEWLRDPVATALWMYAGWFSRRFSRLIAPTKTVADLFAHRTGVEVSTISSGIDLESFHPPACAEESASVRQKWDLPLDVPLLLHVGRLDPEKHVDRVIRAAVGTLVQTNAHMLIVGDGSQRDQLLQQCRDLGVAERVHFTGFVTRGDGLPGLYRIASVFVTASEIETQGIVLLEAAASGLPIVAVRATCIPEVVRDGINGFLTGAGDSAAMSDSLTLLLRDPRMAAKFGEASRALAAQHRLTYTLDEHERLYRELGRWSCIRYPVSGEWWKHVKA